MSNPFSFITSQKYRDNIIDLHIDTLLSKTLNNWYYRNTISTIVYFHNESEQQITNFLLEQFEDREDLPQDTKIDTRDIEIS